MDKQMKVKGPLTDEERCKRALEAIRVQKGFVGKLIESREMIAFAAPMVNVGPNQPSTPYTHMISGASVTTVMTMRKFEDFYSKQICPLIVDRDARQECLWLIHESQNRGLRDSANLIVAHYADESKVPLSQERIDELSKRNRWESFQQLGEWLDQAIPKMQAAKDRLEASLDKRG